MTIQEYEKILISNISLLNNMREIYVKDAELFYIGKKVKMKDYEVYDFDSSEVGIITEIDVCDGGEIYLCVDFDSDYIDSLELTDVILVKDEDETL